MSPLSLRRHRAERLLRDEFEALRGQVLAAVRGRLRASGVSLDQDDLQACYASAWQGLYTVMLEGREIANPAGWLVLVTFRRAIEEHRARSRAHCGAETEIETETPAALAREHDLAQQLDDRLRLRQLFEGLRGRLDAREREAATLCYLQGLTRAQAAARMGVSETRMRKLMEGAGRGRPGVAAKVGALVGTIRDGDWCEEQGSLMRALAFGILDPAGERYRLALMHHSECPACRAYVVSLRGLAAALPPVLLPWGLAAAALARAAEGLHGAGAAGVGATGIGTSAGAQAGRGLGGAAAASGAAGAAGASGAAGGGWLFGAGPLGAKLAVGCLLALSVGAGCVALDVRHGPSAPRHDRRHSASPLDVRMAANARTLGSYPPADLADGAGRALPASDGASGAAAALTAQRRASREFGPEQALAASASSASTAAGSRADATARSASVSSRQPAVAAGGQAGSSAASSPAGVPEPAAAPPTGDSTAAEREFSPG